MGQLLVAGEGHVSHTAFTLIEGWLKRGVPAAEHGAMAVLRHVGMRIAAAICGAAILLRLLVVVAARVRHRAILLVSKELKLGLAHVMDVALKGVLSTGLCVAF